jgi:hypothetical protein
MIKDLSIDGHVLSVRLVRLHDERTVNGLRKIAWPSIFRLKWQHINININLFYTYVQTQTLNTHKKRNYQKSEVANLHLFAANRKEKRKFVFLGRQLINGSRRLLF